MFCYPARMSVRPGLLAVAVFVPSCSPSLSSPQSPTQRSDAPHSVAADAAMIAIPAGSYIAGSTPEEREQAYTDYLRTAGHDAARRNRWFEREPQRHNASLPGFRIDQTQVTQAAYAEFVASTGAALPRITKAQWQQQRFVQHYERHVQRFNWHDRRPPSGRESHPVVLVTWNEAAAYCRWRGQVMGRLRRLPSAAEQEKAARGSEGRVYPWGNQFDPEQLNSHVRGPDDTMPVGSFPSGASPYGVLDAAGNVFEWTSTSWPHKRNGMVVKGSAWDDYGGLGRGAAAHGRRKHIRHVIVGFRCVGPL